MVEKHRDHKMADFWYGGVTRGASWELLRQEMEKNPQADRVVVSTELFFAQVNSVHNVFRHMLDELPGHNIKIVAYLRRQDQFYSSFYNQDVKGMRMWHKSADEFYNTHQVFTKNYYQILKAWADVFGSDNIIVRPFVTSCLVGNDIVTDMAAIVGAEGLHSGSVNENDALGMTQLAIKRAMNRLCKNKDHNEQLLEVIKKLVVEERVKNTWYTNRKTYGHYRSQWERTNKKIEAEFCGGEPLFADGFPKAVDMALAEENRDILVNFVTGVSKLIGSKKESDFYRLLAQSALLIALEYGFYEEIDSTVKAGLVAGCG
ncbi:hypothetical protein [Halioxenophilus sp. WMMB6]|uniref:hypothetical protein n=1 Tax=Halioxenophilus sp. WMMB6 TaxID=3073815 RepID=UPI00295EEBD1|nr:hypothetical protein [Halioxenophilus sp. WMMB6]